MSVLIFLQLYIRHLFKVFPMTGLLGASLFSGDTAANLCTELYGNMGNVGFRVFQSSWPLVYVSTVIENFPVVIRMSERNGVGLFMKETRDVSVNDILSSWGGQDYSTSVWNAYTLLIRTKFLESDEVRANRLTTDSPAP